jgi:hypothetical protein
MDAALSKTANKQLTNERYVARFHAEKAALARDYCNIFKFWRDCPLRRCRNVRRCSGDPTACLKRRVIDVAREVRWQARQKILGATPPEAGPPERMAREILPEGLV